LYLKLSTYTLAFLRTVPLVKSFSSVVLCLASFVAPHFLLGMQYLSIALMVRVNKTQQVVSCHALPTKFHHGERQLHLTEGRLFVVKQV